MESPNFKKVSKTVREILVLYPRTRNSDELLYIKVCEKFNPETVNMSLVYAFYNRKELGLPKFESVRRTRQKLQSKFPELAADDNVEAGRELLEEQYRKFAMEG